MGWGRDQDLVQGRAPVLVRGLAQGLAMEMEMGIMVEIKTMAEMTLQAQVQDQEVRLLEPVVLVRVEEVDRGLTRVPLL